MKKALTILILFTVHTAYAQLPADSIRALMNKEIAAKRSKSIIIGIVTPKGKEVYSAGVKSDENPIPPDANTIYEIGSITKIFTTLLLAEMSLKKQVALNDPISKYLPSTVKTPIRNGKEITLLNLATHRAGFPRNAYNIDPKNPDNPFADYKKKDMYQYISGFELSRDIDSRWQYSNIGYALLGHALELADGHSYETLIEEMICKPLGMKRTATTVPRSHAKNFAQGYTDYGTPVMPWDLPLAGGGGLRSSMNDMLLFAEANLGLSETELQPAIELYHQPQAKKDGQYNYMITMGWTQWNDDGRNIVFKDGGTAGSRSLIALDKKNKVGIVILSTANNLLTDIGLHILDTAHKIPYYPYRWNLADTMRVTINTKGVDAGIALYKELKATSNPAYHFNEDQLNNLGNDLRRAKKTEAAIKIYELNIAEYPKSPMVYESLGETYKRNGDKKAAIPYFEKAKELDRGNKHWEYILAQLRNNLR